VFSGYYEAQIMIGALIVGKGSAGLFRPNANFDGVDRVLAKLDLKSFNEIVFKEAQLSCPRWIRDCNNESCSLHRNRSTLCGNRVTNKFRPPTKNASRDFG